MGKQSRTDAGAERLRQWVAHAEVSFADPSISLERRIHLLRVTGKRLRAILRLAHSVEPRKWPRRHDAALRQAARTLGPYRDGAVSAALLAKREKRERSASRRELWQRWQARANGHLPSGTEPPLVFLTRLLLALEEAEARLGKWLRTEPSTEVLIAAWERSAEDLRAGAAAFFAHPANPVAHAWRKGMKELWFQIEWLQAMGIEAPLAETQSLDRLSSALGRANDFAVLQEALWAVQVDLPWTPAERLVLDGQLETLKRKAWQRVGACWPRLLEALDAAGGPPVEVPPSANPPCPTVSSASGR
jgi:CHAD domain-containing protein